MKARALWVVAPGRVELRDEEVTAGPGEVVVETEVSGISRGTEALVLRGGVPEGERARMRAPLQGGEFPFPVKYGYSAVGRLAGGVRVFVLHPHQDRFAVSETMVVAVPAGVPSKRAVLAANMETALNVVWDGGAAPGDRIAVVGGGVVGALVAWLCGRLPGAEVTLVDVNPARAAVAAALGVAFARPEAAPEGCDLVVHASASADGLATALGCAGEEAVVVEASWYGDRAVAVPLGGAFHSRRLRIIGSQVGQVPPGRRARWSRRRRMEAALGMLADPVLDVLISGETGFEALPGRYAAILDDPGTLCHVVRYP